MRVSVDIGGTKTIFAFLHEHTVLYSHTVPTNTVQDFCSALNTFLFHAGEQGFTSSQCVVACAGPIIDDCCQLTNADVFISKKDILEKTLLGSVRVVNDLFALAHEDEGDIITQSFRDGTRVYISPGTGLGVGLRTKHGFLASEAGHADIAAYNAEELSLLSSASVTNTPEYESVLCGPGLERMYSVLRFEDDPSLSSDEIVAERDNIPAAAQAVRYFGLFLGRCARNLVLAVNADRIVLSGGVLQRNMSLFEQYFFSELLLGRYKEILNTVSVQVISDPLAVVRGAARIPLQ